MGVGLFNYDGERPEWSVLHTFGTVCMANGAFDVGEKCIEQALLHNPSSRECFITLKEIRAIKKQQDEMLKQEEAKRKHVSNSKQKHRTADKKSAEKAHSKTTAAQPTG